MLSKIGKALIILVLSLVTTACNNIKLNVENDDTQLQEKVNEENIIYAIVGDKSMEIILENNTSAIAFYELLSDGNVVVDMHDYGKFEKVGDIGSDLPQNNQEITTEPGDVILWQGNSITIYYDVNSWSLTRLGKIRNISQQELISILGGGEAKVTFSLKKMP